MATDSEPEEIETDIECPAASDSESKSSGWGSGRGNQGASGLPKQFDQGLPGTLKSAALKKPSESSTESSGDGQNGPATPRAESAAPEDPATAAAADADGKTSGRSETSTSSATTSSITSTATSSHNTTPREQSAGKWDIPKEATIPPTTAAQPSDAPKQQLSRADASTFDELESPDSGPKDGKVDDDFLNMWTRVDRKTTEASEAVGGYQPSVKSQLPSLGAFPTTKAENVLHLDDLLPSDGDNHNGLEAKSGLAAKTIDSLFMTPTPTEERQPASYFPSGLSEPSKPKAETDNFTKKLSSVLASESPEKSPESSVLEEIEDKPKSPLKLPTMMQHPPRQLAPLPSTTASASLEFDDLVPSDDEKSAANEPEKSEKSTITRNFSSSADGEHQADARGAQRADSQECTAHDEDEPLKFSNLPLPRFHIYDALEKIERRQSLLAEARSEYLQKKTDELPSNEMLAHAHRLLTRKARSRSRSESKSVSSEIPEMVDEVMIDWDDFVALRDSVHPSLSPFFSVQLFARLQAERDSLGRVPAKSVFKFIMRKVWLQRSRLSLAVYDSTGTGCLTEHDLETYINHLMPTIPQLANLEKPLRDFYVCTAVRRFMFFLDPKHFGRVRIADILASGFLDDLIALKEDTRADEPVTNNSTSHDASRTERSEKTNSADHDSNWFSSENASRVYYQYLNLDSDRNGMLSMSELQEYGGGTLTQPFLTRLFQECVTYRTNDEHPTQNEMDYKSYLDFVLAMENKQDPVSVEYFFRILDVRQLGHLDGFAFNYFFRAIYDNLVETAQHDDELVDFFDVKDEIFDMVRPADPHKITLQDLLDSRQGDTVVSILIDTEGFWRYDNREMLANEDDEEDV